MLVSTPSLPPWYKQSHSFVSWGDRNGKTHPNHTHSYFLKLEDDDITIKNVPFSSAVVKAEPYMKDMASVNM
jgi:hypothetical protein